MYTQTPRHPRAGAAVGLAILAAWLGAVGVALATDDAPDDTRAAAPASVSAETGSVGPGDLRAAP